MLQHMVTMFLVLSELKTLGNGAGRAAARANELNGVVTVARDALSEFMGGGTMGKMFLPHIFAS